jgi:hypothetical protein
LLCLNHQILVISGSLWGERYPCSCQEGNVAPIRAKSSCPGSAGKPQLENCMLNLQVSSQHALHLL